MRKILLLLLLFQSVTCIGQIEEVRRITKKLCSPEFGGRGYINGGDSVAALFIASEFEKLNLKKVKGSYFQSFSFDVNTFPGKMEVRHKGRSLSPGSHFLINPSSGGANGSLRPKLVPIEVALDQDVLIDLIKSIKRNEADFNSLAFRTSTLKGDTLKSISALMYEVSSVLPVFEITDKKFTWSVGRNHFNNSFIQIQDSVYIENEAFDVEIDARFKKNHTTQNVIAYLPGKRKCKRTYVFTAHYDHLGKMGEHTYFPGANDNASGTAMLISMAKYFKEHPIDANIYFIAFAGEEAGLLGSKHFVENPLVPLKKIDFLVNLDIMGSGEDGITVVNGTLFPKEFEKLQQINAEHGLLKEVKLRGPAANSDHYWFTEKGVPAFFIYTMGPNKNYHDVFDNYESLSFVEYDDITTLLVKFLEELR